MGKFFMSVATFTLFVAVALSVTNEEDVYALNVLFTALNSPTTLLQWRSIGGDPCGENWAGVGCVGPNVTKLHLSDLHLTGGLGYALENFTALYLLDLSSNDLAGDIPYQLPPNLEQLVLSDNHFIGNLPYSVTYLNNLEILNVSNNMLSGQIPDIFETLEKLTKLDLSANNLSGPLPLSFGTLTHINTMWLQNNSLSGTVDILANLPLKDLDISNNSFTGWIPSALAAIPSFKYAGNQLNLSTGIPSPSPGLPPSSPSSRVPQPKAPSNRRGTQIGSGSAKYLTGGHVAGIAIAAALAAITTVLVVLFFFWKSPEHAVDGKDCERNYWQGSALSPAHVDPKEQSDSYSEQKHYPAPEVVTLKPYGSWNQLNPKENSVDGEVLTKNIKGCIAATSYTIGELQTATNSFSQENLIGEGASARVYKAKLSNGKILAVKKLDSSISIVHERDFLDVLIGISRLRHANITELVGYCVHQGHRLLVYEYISNGTLNETLHCSEEKSRRLSWNLRMRIALGAARALEYLHEICQPTVVHRNFKSSNILLDEEFNPHLSDCGLVSLTSFGSERQFSSQHMGSFGYSAPEFAMSGIYSVKSDVYSFGVVMLEILTGRKPLDSSRPRAEQSLVRWATPQLHDIDALSKMVDPALKGIYPAKSLSRFADLIAVCVQPEPEFRPCMSEVTQSLVRLLQRASLNKRRSGEDFGSSQRIFDSLSEV